MEVLAPAGDEQMLRAAVYSGADCVYLGVDGFNARRGAANFDGLALAEAVRFCHARNCRVYAAINTLVFAGEEQKLLDALHLVAEAGCDAIIVQDLWVGSLVKKHIPHIALHGSTQMSVHSAAGVKQLADMGFDRVILSRELTAQEIEEIAKQSTIELEVFVHGALCVCISGQCNMSAFLGGRSANRGSCAGTCRFPFEAVPDKQLAEDASPVKVHHHLSLKDLSILDALPKLREMGVVSAKIEGRLRGPEYCAMVVDSARKVLAGQPYDKVLLQEVFSRSGFTDGWYTGKNDGEMFGIRTAQDSADSKSALSKVRELYRREMPRVAVEMRLALHPEGGTLRITDGENEVCGSIDGPLEEANRDATESLERALQKTGGTPFYAQRIAIETNGLFAAGAVVGALRRALLEELLTLRSAVTPLENNVPVVYLPQQKSTNSRPENVRFRARFEALAQVPADVLQWCEELILPLEEAEKVPQEWRAATWLWLPRVEFGPLEKKVEKLVQKAAQMGFKGFEANNLAHLQLCRGLPVSAGQGLNLSNAGAVQQAFVQGCKVATVLPELSLSQIKEIANELGEENERLDMLLYGYLPLMVTRACPFKIVTDCSNCKAPQGEAVLVDRKGAKFPVLCRDGVRHIYNTVPLWMADRLHEVPTKRGTLWFTTEAKQDVENVLRAFHQKSGAGEGYTRGLYYRGINDK